MAGLLVALDVALGLAIGAAAFVLFVARPWIRCLRECAS